MKIKKAGVFTKLFVLIVGVWAVVTLVGLGGRIDAAEAGKDRLADQVQEQQAKNDALRHSIENSSDPAVIRDVARQQLGLVLPGEIIFYEIG